MHELLTQVQYAPHDSILLVAHNDTLQVSASVCTRLHVMDLLCY